MNLEPNDWSPGDIIDANEDGTIVLDDGITTHNKVRAKDYLAGYHRGKQGVCAMCPKCGGCTRGQKEHFHCRQCKCQEAK